MTADTLPSPHFAAPRGLALGLAGAVAFGAAAGLGHGAAALARGAWMSPALFVGGALLAAPPLYLAASYSGSRASAEEVIAEVADVLGRAGVVLLGLAAPAAFFSATLRTPTAWALLVGLAVVVGAVAVRAVARRTLSHATTAAWLWTFFSLALGVRLLLALARHTPVAHLVYR
ncbi:MAG: hypothetical protein JWM10_5371 [Myxococcaceae bacterium]|nr:hypothetical protein [Myxococcaceae bacterium]